MVSKCELRGVEEEGGRATY